MTETPDRPEVDDPRVVTLAKARQQMAYENPFNAGYCPPWDGLTGQEQHLSLLDARNYLRAALNAGLVAAAGPAPATDQAAPVCKFDEGCHRVQACDPGCAVASARMYAQLAAAQSAATVQAALRDRIRQAVCEAEGFGWDTDMLEPDEYGEVADAVLAVLSNPTVDGTTGCLEFSAGNSRQPGVGLNSTGRAAVLREAADRFDGWVRPPSSPDRFAAGVRWVTVSLRRMADETRQPETRDALMHVHVALAAQAGRHQAAVARVRGWVTSDVVTARNEFGSGYREAQRDIHDLLGRDRAAAPDDYEATTGHAITCFAVAGSNPDPDCPCATAAPAVAQPDEEPRTVAYRSPQSLYCLRHTGEIVSGFTPVTSEDLPDGGMCAYPECGTDVLIPQNTKETETL